MKRLDLYQDKYTAPEWDDLPLEMPVEDAANDARIDALRESFNSFHERVAFNLHHNMQNGYVAPATLRDAVRRLSDMLQIAGETGDYKTEAKIVNCLTRLCTVAQQTLYN
ncbi:hypothetical protein KTD13_01805 [Burkholderia multivorans]|uniref:hypothetical protein n=1 Tax=Burkholderia multivorans TaxID=87883 RepID=UPI001C223E02|nr:hypothetical protein [Burkholderia multivorans]MBU9259081.1 hypothetical protein [Burkholderia multivorans]